MENINVIIPIEKYEALKNREAELLKKIEDLYETHNKELEGFKNGENSIIIDYVGELTQYVISNNIEVLERVECILDFANKNNRSFWKR
jgi:hypothetical protein